MCSKGVKALSVSSNNQLTIRFATTPQDRFVVALNNSSIYLQYQRLLQTCGLKAGLSSVTGSPLNQISLFVESNRLKSLQITGWQSKFHRGHQSVHIHVVLDPSTHPSARLQQTSYFFIKLPHP